MREAKKPTRYSDGRSAATENQHSPTINNIVSTTLLVIGCHYSNALLLTVFKLFPLFSCAQIPTATTTAASSSGTERIRRNMTRESVLIFGRRVHAYPPQSGSQMLHSNGPNIDEIRFTAKEKKINLISPSHSLSHRSPSRSKNENEFLMTALTDILY